jgi:hypothetical protein
MAGVILQQAALVAVPKAREWRLDAATERNDLEQLSHLARAQQFVRLRGKRQIVRCILRRRTFEQTDDIEIDQELGLRRIAEEIESRAAPRLSDRSKVDMARDVLQPGREERIVVGVMTLMAHQGTVIALRMIVLALPETIVDDQHGAAFQVGRECAYQRGRGEADLAEIWRPRI